MSSSPLAPPWYGPGEQIQFTVEFSLPVTVAGDPELEFSVTTPSPNNERMSYLSGSGTTELVFSYTVRTGDDDADGIWWNANSLRLDSNDSITGVYNGLDALLDHSGPGKLEGHRIDQNPRAVSQEVTSDPTDGTLGHLRGGRRDHLRGGVQPDGDHHGRSAAALQHHRDGRRVRGLCERQRQQHAAVLLHRARNRRRRRRHLPLRRPARYPDDADSIVGADNNLPAVNEISGQERTLPGHKVDGTITN